MTYIFAGWLFVFFHIKINGFDFLPDFLGYVLILLGLFKLVEKSKNFEKAKPYTIGMIIYSFIPIGMNYVPIKDGKALLMTLSLISNFVMLYIMYLINNGIHDIEKDENINLGTESLFKIWRIQAILQIIAIALSLFNSPGFTPIVLLLTYAFLIVTIVYLVFFYKSKKSYDNFLQKQL